MSRRKKHHYLIPGTKDLYSENVGVVEIDKGIALTIQILNHKGYKTVASCAGHYHNGGITDNCGYIWIRNGVRTPLPEGVIRDGGCIRWIPDSLIELKKIYKDLEVWAHNLKYRGSR